ncbi:3'-5' exonuclease [Tenacibaculum finnmarkense]|uniref:DNA 3'-5' helicase II n=1 Tax=Tenacibaculum finnmarkense genomovar ulcerans TaxID=2781388 RepID=A0A2I2MAL0_9FLAO|nr:3'-5' exonuclease [Tenacibaculum finnmarkense]ALU74431.1 hypothetical protein AUW17_03725 [Tenacibaculum dicentrarchi]MBE7698411.1 AAA family ATPase [Tenacibaculum finnmarkense genomovar ulcerans]MCD8423222.1 AAA family ATPase [Tenacibaculum finnmarkense genomovar ulcerans]MCG8239507.1 AAA family ATPase [Tenacibaculum finnmarkense genomovar ulcerans]SOU89585.1 conserved hypothetical protein [Tenacibaculum finnmarkense genomovar ulcerans]
MLIPYNQLSNEQKGVIRSVSRETGNLFVEGPPGSGKTLISLYTLGDIVKKENIRPLLLMYNHSLYGYLSSELSELGIRDNITLATKDTFFWNLAREHDIKPPNYDARYGEKYEFVLRELSAIAMDKQHDITVIDEIQDLMIEEWEVLKKISKRILTLGDFNQGIYKTNLTRDKIKDYGVFESLSVIYRFHKNIAKLASYFSENKEDIVGKVDGDSQTQPELIDVKRSEDFSKVAEILKQIKSYRKSIGVISPNISRLKQLNEYLKNNGIENNYYPSTKDLRTHDFTSTIPLLISSHSSKGLEFESVILFGFDKGSGAIYHLERENKLNNIIYVSMTRTNNHLYIVRTEDTIQELKNLTVDKEVEKIEMSIDDIF